MFTVKKYSIKQLRKIMTKQVVKQFVCEPLIYKDTKKKVICQIKDCNSDHVSWLTVTKHGEGISLCFHHGEEL